MQMMKINDKKLAKTAADIMVLILFFVLLSVILGFACMLYFTCWVVGIL